MHKYQNVLSKIDKKYSFSAFVFIHRQKSEFNRKFIKMFRNLTIFVQSDLFHKIGICQSNFVDNNCKTWKTPWKTCKSHGKSGELSTFPRFLGVEKWVKVWEITHLPKMVGVEFKKIQKNILTKNIH